MHPESSIVRMLNENAQDADPPDDVESSIRRAAVYNDYLRWGGSHHRGQAFLDQALCVPDRYRDG
jgi:hypothetical protein